MKITKAQLRKLIKEELGDLSSEYSPAVEITAMAESIRYLIRGSVEPMVRSAATDIDASPDARRRASTAIIEQLDRIREWAREISMKAKAL